MSGKAPYIQVRLVWGDVVGRVWVGEFVGEVYAVRVFVMSRLLGGTFSERPCSSQDGRISCRMV